ncbi:unnamed protein product [Protopolystoma xenopodis]|uniref:DNA-directed RNA polymerase n=1 Tax=Protopolystoma xenopodis TaxID=117903 RepID=A0A3S5CUH2_9PLAT|nr:unnamed protein product [Protopolystoma xenopodis]
MMAITRHGVNRLDTGALARCSFEETVDILMEAATHAERDPMAGVSENIMLGQMARIGTGCFDLLLDTTRCQEAQPIPLTGGHMANSLFNAPGFHVATFAGSPLWNDSSLQFGFDQTGQGGAHTPWDAIRSPTGSLLGLDASPAYRGVIGGLGGLGSGGATAPHSAMFSPTMSRLDSGLSPGRSPQMDSPRTPDTAFSPGGLYPAYPSPMSASGTPQTDPGSPGSSPGHTGSANSSSLGFADDLNFSIQSRPTYGGGGGFTGTGGSSSLSGGAGGLGGLGVSAYGPGGLDSAGSASPSFSLTHSYAPTSVGYLQRSPHLVGAGSSSSSGLAGLGGLGSSSGLGGGLGAASPGISAGSPDSLALYTPHSPLLSATTASRTAAGHGVGSGTGGGYGLSTSASSSWAAGLLASASSVTPGSETPGGLSSSSATGSSLLLDSGSSPSLGLTGASSLRGGVSGLGAGSSSSVTGLGLLTVGSSSGSGSSVGSGVAGAGSHPSFYPFTQSNSPCSSFNASPSAPRYSPPSSLGGSSMDTYSPQMMLTPVSSYISAIQSKTLDLNL